MPLITRHSLITLAVLALAALLVLGIFIWSGIYNIGADDRHSRPVHTLLQVMRERSIAVRAGKLPPPPNLDDSGLIRQGAGNYHAMCSGCHLAPGMAETELSKGLNPAPPNLATADVGDAAQHFWVIKHGIKASGMPAWGQSMDDEYIWGMVAFLQRMPGLDATQYQALVASSDGHSHGGGESGSRAHGDHAGADHDAMHEHGTLPAGGSGDTVPRQVQPSGTPADHHHPAMADDGHDHDHDH
jgi:mono/diheme cytochrome c family protein